MGNASVPAFRTYVLLVGVSDYDCHSDLVNPILDVNAIEKELSEIYRCEVTLIHNPTQDEFLTALHRLADIQYGHDDQLLVFFAGHGWYDERIKRGYLALKDTKAKQDDNLYN